MIEADSPLIDMLLADTSGMVRFCWCLAGYDLFDCVASTKHTRYYGKAESGIVFVWVHPDFVTRPDRVILSIVSNRSATVRFVGGDLVAMTPALSEGQAVSVWKDGVWLLPGPWNWQVRSFLAALCNRLSDKEAEARGQNKPSFVTEQDRFLLDLVKEWNKKNEE